MLNIFHTFYKREKSYPCMYGLLIFHVTHDMACGIDIVRICTLLAENRISLYGDYFVANICSFELLNCLWLVCRANAVLMHVAHRPMPMPMMMMRESVRATLTLSYLCSEQLNLNILNWRWHFHHSTKLMRTINLH